MSSLLNRLTKHSFAAQPTRQTFLSLLEFPLERLVNAQSLTQTRLGLFNFPPICTTFVMRSLGSKRLINDKSSNIPRHRSADCPNIAFAA
jgi:hypothetical protein